MVGANGFTLDLDSYDGCLGVLLFKVKEDLGRVRVRVCVCVCVCVDDSEFIWYRFGLKELWLLGVSCQARRLQRSRAFQLIKNFQTCKP